METFLEYYQNYVLLKESRKHRYLQMFADFIEGGKYYDILDKASQSNDVQGSLSEQVEEYVKDVVDEAIKIFEREDRIIWYLRIKKYWLILNYSDPSYVGSEVSKSMVNAAEKIANKFKYVRVTSTHNLTDNFLHWKSLNIPELNDIQFYNQNWDDELKPIMDRVESEYYKGLGDKRELIDITEELKYDEIETLIDFGDGMRWLNLNRKYCEDEGDAMGHCGNTAAYRTGETILSLRNVVQKQNRFISRPVATFIYDKNTKTLGEMKGRGNQKPNKKYHKYIVGLLKHKVGGGYMISGLDGGGYAPEENFDVDDLDLDMSNDLFELRPELANLKWHYQNNEPEGFVEFLVNEHSAEYEQSDFIQTKDGRWHYVSERFDTVGDFLEELDSDDDLNRYRKYVIDGEYMEWGNYSSLGESDFREIIDDYLNDEQIENILDTLRSDDLLKSDIDEKLEGNYSKNEVIVEYIINADDAGVSGVKDTIQRLYDQGLDAGSESEMFKAFMDGLESLEISIMIEDPNGYEDKEVNPKLEFSKGESGGILVDDEVLVLLTLEGVVDMHRAVETTTEFSNGMEEPYYGFGTNGVDEGMLQTYIDDSFDDILGGFEEMLDSPEEIID